MSIINIPLRRFLHQPDVEFEYDPIKSEANLEKHGIDFEQAQELWKGRTVALASSKDFGEPGFLVLGMIDGKHWTAAITYRGSRIRIISVRRSRRKEELYYDERD